MFPAFIELILLVVAGLLIGAWFILKNKDEEQVEEIVNGGFVMLA